MRVRRYARQRSLWVVLPFRGINQGKSRLASLLDANERARFNRWLLIHTLHIVAAWQGNLARCVVVSGCARALRAAHVMGAKALPEPYPHGDLNRSIGRATRAAHRYGARCVLVLSGDLPWLSTRALDTLLDVASTGTQVVLATDVAKTGTNALLLNARGRFALRYGAGSRMRHIESAQQRGWSTLVISRAELAQDIDTPNDFARWRAHEDARKRMWPMV